MEEPWTQDNKEMKAERARVRYRMTKPNKALQRRPRSKVLMGSREAVPGPAERER